MRGVIDPGGGSPCFRQSGVGSGALPIHGEGVRRTRFRAARWAPALLVTLAVLLGACSAESPDSGSVTAGSAKSSTPTESEEPEKPGGLFDPFDPDEPTLPGGVKVLSQDVNGFAPVDAGRYAVRVSESLLYQFDLPAYSDVHSGVYLNPGRRAGGDFDRLADRGEQAHRTAGSPLPRPRPQARGAHGRRPGVSVEPPALP